MTEHIDQSLELQTESKSLIGILLLSISFGIIAALAVGFTLILMFSMFNNWTFVWSGLAGVVVFALTTWGELKHKHQKK